MKPQCDEYDSLKKELETWEKIKKNIHQYAIYGGSYSWDHLKPVLREDRNGMISWKKVKDDKIRSINLQIIKLEGLEGSEEKLKELRQNLEKSKKEFEEFCKKNEQRWIMSDIESSLFKLYDELRRLRGGKHQENLEELRKEEKKQLGIIDEKISSLKDQVHELEGIKSKREKMYSPSWDFASKYGLFSKKENRKASCMAFGKLSENISCETAAKVCCFLNRDTIFQHDPRSKYGDHELAHMYEVLLNAVECDKLSYQLKRMPNYLEIGGFDLSIILLLLNKIEKATIVDIDPKIIERAEEIAKEMGVYDRIEFVCSDVMDFLKEKNNKQDICSLRHVLYFLENERKKEFFELLPQTIQSIYITQFLGDNECDVKIIKNYMPFFEKKLLSTTTFYETTSEYLCDIASKRYEIVAEGGFGDFFKKVCNRYDKSLDDIFREFKIEKYDEKLHFMLLGPKSL